MPLQATSGAASQDAFGGNGVAVVPTYIEDVFSTWLYTGNGSTQTITNGIDLSTYGGLVWLKDRIGATNHQLYDTQRGVEQVMYSNSTSASSSSAETVTAFNTTGFTVGQYGVNSVGQSPVSWTFREQPKFFDIVTYTGNGSGATKTISHNLGSAPACIFVKKTNTSQDWLVFHKNTSQPHNKYLILNSTVAEQSYDNIWGENGYLPTTTQFKVSGYANDSGATYVAYIFAHNAGGFGLTGTDNVISCGSFNYNTDPQTVTIGYEPQWLMVKRSDGVGDWIMFDNMRGFTANAGGGIGKRLLANTSGAETANDGLYYGGATGFNLNLPAYGNYIYIAIRRGPMKVPTTGTSVFAPSVRASGTGAAVSTTGVGFPPDLLISTERTTGVLFAKGWHDRLRGNVILISNSTNNEAADSTGVTAYGQDGFSFGADGGFATVNYSGSNYVYESFRRAPSFFDEVCYTGTLATLNVSHNLGVVPQLIITKSRSATGNWTVQPLSDGTKRLRLQTTAAETSDAGPWGNTNPTSSVFTLGADTATNASGVTYVAYLFATCAGVSKVGSYTGTATTKQIDCGFTAGARFVLIKRTDDVGDWYVWDSARGIIAGNDPYLLLNSTAAEVTSTDYIDTYSAGFEISSTAPAAINASGGSFIFLAIS